MFAKSLSIAGCLLLSFFTFNAKAQLYKDYDWESNPAIHSLSDENKGFPSVVIKHSRLIEWYPQNGVTVQYTTIHKIAHVTTDAGIEKLNKVAIPVYGSRELVTLKVRAIDRDGHITNFKKENLKELENVSGYGNVKIFAIEGVSVDGEIEYLYTLKSGAQPFGSEIFQEDVPVLDANLDIVYPAKFIFSVKCYNGLHGEDEPVMLDNRRKAISIKATNIPALAEEEYSAYRADLMRVDYKMESNGYVSGIMSWGNIAERLLATLYDHKGSAKVSKFLKSLNIDEMTSADKVIAIEKYIKTNFTIKEGNNESYEDLKQVIENKVGNERGLAKLYLSCWDEINVPSQLVFTTDRQSGTIDPQFASPNAIREILFYFPAFDKYISPSLPYMRFGPAPSGIAAGNGLFVSYFINQARQIEYAKSEVRQIEPLDFTHNKVGVKATVNFNKGITNPEISQENFWQGYRAFLYRSYYSYLPENTRDDFVKDATVSAIDNFSIIRRETEGEDVNLSIDPDNYFRIKTTYTTTSLVETAGNDYLVAVGKLIGKQSELYQEKKRQTDISFQSITDYHHELTIEIPEGYTCSGLDNIRISNKVEDSAHKVLMKFESDYTLEGNKLIIRINEVYKVVTLPKEQYDAFRAVVNSAADFNKVAIVLHPKM